MRLQDEITDLRINLYISLENAKYVVSLTDQVIEIANANMEAVSSSLQKLKVGGGTIGQINNLIKSLENLNNNPAIQAQREVVEEQVIVLLVGSLETYLGDYIRLIGNLGPDLFDFKNKDERITFTQDMLKEGFKLGDAILEHIKDKGYSLQDLKSSLEVFKNYLSINIHLTNDVRDDLILCAAIRNCIVHSASQIDRKFMKQVRNTKYKNKYKIGGQVTVDQYLIDNSVNAISDYADQLTAAITSSEIT